MRRVAFLMLILMGGMNEVLSSAKEPEVLSYASMETEYEGFQLLVEAVWYKVPAIDVIEASVSMKGGRCSKELCPAFFLRYPDEEETNEANVPLEEDCLGLSRKVTVKFHIWCHDFGGWSVFVHRDGQFHFIGRTRLDSPTGDWTVVVVDRETGDVVAELPLFVGISKPTKTAEHLKKKFE